MDFQAIQDSKGHWRIRADSGGATMWGVPQGEELLVPEARRIHKKLGELIARCEQGNRPPIPRFGSHA